jgi:hypothetical protein
LNEQLRASKIPESEFTTLPNGLKYVLAPILLHVSLILGGLVLFCIMYQHHHSPYGHELVLQ